MKYSQGYRTYNLDIEPGEEYTGKFRPYVEAYAKIETDGYDPVLEALEKLQLSPSSSINQVRLYEQAYNDGHFNLVLHYIEEDGIKGSNLLNFFEKLLFDLGNLDLANPAAQEQKKEILKIIDFIIGRATYVKVENYDSSEEALLDKIQQASNRAENPGIRKEFEKLTKFIKERKEGLSEQQTAALSADKGQWKEAFFSHHVRPTQNEDKEDKPMKPK